LILQIVYSGNLGRVLRYQRLFDGRKTLVPRHTRRFAHHHRIPVISIQPNHTPARFGSGRHCGPAPAIDPYQRKNRANSRIIFFVII
jgi:hypothetical protein